MTTEHFNGLTEAEAERLALLIEECAEVQAMACKILRHGFESVNPCDKNPNTNRKDLSKELGHLAHAIGRMVRAGDVSNSEIKRHEEIKASQIHRWLHHDGF